MENDKSSIKIINSHQKHLYEAYEETNSKIYMDNYSDVLERIKTKDDIRILDIGGAGGHFAAQLYKFLDGMKRKITVLDSTEYGAWETYSRDIEFIKESVDNIDKLFSENTFDIVFANKVFHHFVKGSWKGTINGIKESLRKIYKILKTDGLLCAADHFYNGMVYDEITSRIIYGLTSCSIPAVVKTCKKLGAESAGTGVCFLSKKMWIKYIGEGGFKIEEINEIGRELKLKLYKKILLCAKKITLGNVIICKK
jgi:ubiquinone/menaquinone biosynthesis C-methylase UbiE